MLVLKIISFFSLSFSNVSYAKNVSFQELNKSPEAVQKMKLGYSYNVPAVVIQNRSVDRTLLSEFFVGFSPVVSGSLYSYSGSFDGSYHIHLSPRWSLGVKYSHFLHRLNRDGTESLHQLKRIPLLLKHVPTRAYHLQINSYPLYGKFAVGTKAIHFDVYTSLSFTQQTPREIKRKVPAGSLGLGLVIWWNQHLNSRTELSGQYYSYTSGGLKQSVISTYFNFSLGFLL